MTDQRQMVKLGVLSKLSKLSYSPIGRPALALALALAPAPASVVDDG